MEMRLGKSCFKKTSNSVLTRQNKLTRPLSPTIGYHLGLVKVIDNFLIKSICQGLGGHNPFLS